MSKKETLPPRSKEEIEEMVYDSKVPINWYSLEERAMVIEAMIQKHVDRFFDKMEKANDQPEAQKD